MKYYILRKTGFFDQPNGTKVYTLFPNEVVEATGQTNGPMIEVILDGGSRGWISSTDCAPDTGPRPSVDRDAFVGRCISIERTMNALPTTAPWFVAADFVLARGLIETDLENVGPAPGTTAVGPLKVTQTEWDAFLTFLKNDGKSLSGAGQYQSGDYDHWLMQIWGATYRMLADAKAISDKKTAAAGLKDKFIPSYLDLFHTYLTNVDAAIAILDANSSDQDRTKSLLTVLQPVMSQVETTTLFTARSNFTGTLTTPKTVADFVAATGAKLGDALKSAFDLIKQFAPEELPQIQQGEAPWFDVALKAEHLEPIRAVTSPFACSSSMEASQFSYLGATRATAFSVRRFPFPRSAQFNGSISNPTPLLRTGRIRNLPRPRFRSVLSI